MKTILSVEDNREIQILVKAALEQHSVYGVETVQAAREFLSRQSVDLLILDIELPDGNGLDFLAEIEGTATPTFILTANTEISKKLIAFSLGADDFLTKPFDPLELRARVNAKLKKSTKTSEERNLIRLRNVTVEIESQRVYINRSGSNRPDLDHTAGGGEPNKVPINLTSMEFRLLVTFIRSPDKVFSRQALLDRVWGIDVNVTDRTVDTHVNHLRRKMKDSDIKIETVLSEGYRLLV